MSTSAGPQTIAYWSGFGRLPIVKSLLVAIVYLVGAEIAFLIGTLSDKVFAPLWPPNIVLLCALAFAPARDWWVYLVAVFPAHAAAELGVGMPWPQILVAFVTNCLVAILSVAAMRRLLIGAPWFGSLRKSLLYIVVAAFVSPAVVAFGGAFVSVFGGGSLQDYPVFWLQWFLSNALSSLTLGPLALIVLSRVSWIPTLSARQIMEGAALALMLILICVLALKLSANSGFRAFVPALFLPPLALMICLALRFGVTGASVAILIMTIVTIEQTLNGNSPFAVANAEAAVFSLQMFLVFLAVPTLLLGAAADEARRAISAADRNHELMAWSTTAASISLWQYNRSTEEFWMSDNGRTMFGLGATASLTRDMIEQTIHPDDRQAAIDALRATKSADSLTMTDFRILWPSGEVRWLRARGRAHENGQGDAAVVSGTFADITERKAAEDETAQRKTEMAHFMRVSMLGELSGGIAHELAQPLTAILSNAQAARQLIERDISNIEDVKAALDDIINDDNRASQVLQRMRSFLKRGSENFETVDLSDIIGSTLQLLHSELIGRRVKIKYDLDSTLPLVCGDRIQLQQVLLNLFMNAVDSMEHQAPSQRMITVRTHRMSEGEVEVSIADHGAGLTQADEDLAFQPFFTTKERGLGLGLSICSSIIRSHGGRLRLANNPDGGATATFVLPYLG